MTRWLLVDYGGVLAFSHLPRAETELALLFGCDIAGVRSAITEKSELGQQIRLDRLSEEEFWKAVTRQLTGQPHMPATAAELTRLWSASYSIDPTVAEALQAAALQGIRIGVATNIDRYREKHMAATIDAAGLEVGIFPSYRLGAIKPASDFFARIEQEIAGSGQCAAEIAFVDDRPEHVAAAQAHGWTALRYAQNPRIFFDIAGLAVPTQYGGTDA